MARLARNDPRKGASRMSSLEQIACGIDRPRALRCCAQPGAAPPTGRRGPVTVVVPLGAGGNTDMMARLGAQRLSREIRPAVRGREPPERRRRARHRTGRGGRARTATRSCSRPPRCCCSRRWCRRSRSTPTSSSCRSTNVGTGTQMIAIRRSLPVKTLAEFIAHAKANPGKLNLRDRGRQQHRASRAGAAVRARRRRRGDDPGEGRPAGGAGPDGRARSTSISATRRSCCRMPTATRSD